MPEIVAQSLLRSPAVAGRHREAGAEEYTRTTQLVFAYRGVFMRHVGQDQAIAKANRVLFFNATEGYRVSHPVAGGDASISVIAREFQ